MRCLDCPDLAHANMPEDWVPRQVCCCADTLRGPTDFLIKRDLGIVDQPLTGMNRKARRALKASK